MQNQGISLNQPRAGIHPARSHSSWTAPSWQIGVYQEHAIARQTFLQPGAFPRLLGTDAHCVL